ncbi:Protein SHOOT GRAVITROPISM 5 [Dichanthelium oligosanthes]|uniref:Protein SHOOT GRAVITROPISM 5 n=1 Tax=Dichanthelium oligosanthes TaxID=888268 RepID=A0A1E5W8D8_9POAL|nr:Protein SHOOT GRAVITROPISM 5 [Dichanthelium oligosanthes]
MLSSCAPTALPPQEAGAAPPEPFRSLQIATTSGAGAKKKRRPAGTPDPDAEVVSLSPRTLLESDRYVCEICGQGFQRDQNLQMHRRRHKVPWKLLKREAGEAARKRVFVCPEPSCLHHDPSHALGDLVGIKKHFRRKHSGHRQWACARCSKAYAVHSDYKAHLKTCGTRGHTCDCGRVFSRVESFIEHQDTCNAGRPRAETLSSPASGGGGGGAGFGVAASTSQHQQQQRQMHAAAAALSRTASSASPSSGGDLRVSPVAWPGPAMASPTAAAAFHLFDPALSSPPTPHERPGVHNLELQLMPPRGSCGAPVAIGCCATQHSAHAVTPHMVADPMRLQLSIGFGVGGGGARDDDGEMSASAAAARLKEEAREQLRLAMAEKAAADEARAQARQQAEMAEKELASARRMRQQAQAELGRAHALRDHAVRQVDATLLQVTCYSCRCKFRARATGAMSSEVASYVSSVVTEGGDAEVDDNHHHHHRQLNADDAPSHARTMMDIN